LEGALVLKSFKFTFLTFGVIVGQLVSPSLGVSQEAQTKGLPMWKEARRPAAKGTRIPLPAAILRQIEAEKLTDSETTEKPEDPCNSKERAKLTAYLVSLHGRDGSGVLVRAANLCYCGATGNCLFWVFRATASGYQLLLKTDNVQDFGLLASKTLGYRDLVVWSHDSAQRSPARLFQFDGKEYQEICGWEEDYEFKELPNGRWVSVGDPKIVGSTCDELPSSEELRK
jgi:hypothetical protein